MVLPVVVVILKVVGTALHDPVKRREGIVLLSFWVLWLLHTQMNTENRLTGEKQIELRMYAPPHKNVRLQNKLSWAIEVCLSI